MKKVFSIVLSLLMISILLIGCGSEKEETNEVKLVTKTVNKVSISVPSDYSEFKDTDGFMAASGPNASITISPVVEAVDPSMWTEESLRELYADKYSEIVFKNIIRDVKVEGGSAIYVIFTSTAKEGGTKFDTRLVLLYTEENTMYSNYVAFKDGADCSTAKFADEIMKSMKIVK
ncbi:MAG: hypothetical protein RR630_08250 [Coprobacillus sp.]